MLRKKAPRTYPELMRQLCVLLLLAAVIASVYAFVHLVSSSHNDLPLSPHQLASVITIGLLLLSILSFFSDLSRFTHSRRRIHTFGGGHSQEPLYFESPCRSGQINMTCDICSVPGIGTQVSSEDFMRGVCVCGFNPFQLGLANAGTSSAAGLDPNSLFESWKTTMVCRNTTPWNVCQRCMRFLEPHLPQRKSCQKHSFES